MGKIIAGLSKKRPGSERYSSNGYELSVELETHIVDPEAFHRSVKSLFDEINAALDAEIANTRHAPILCDVRGARFVGSGSGNGNGAKALEPISDKQAEYLRQLLSRRGLDGQDAVATWLEEAIGVRVTSIRDLDKKSASKAIEVLKSQRCAP
jgi:hypothetical protein